MDIPLRVLIIEDSDRDVALEVRALEEAGYRVTYAVADTAAEMKAALVKQAFDIVISDHDLPQFDAPGALAVLKQSGQDIPFIIVSGVIGEEAAVALMKAGAHDYVMKKNLSRLVPAVQRELKEAGSRRERKRVEEKLRESEERYKHLFNNAQVGLFRSRISDGKILACNERFARGSGYSNPEECCEDYVSKKHYVDSEERRRMLGELLKQGQVNNFELQVTKRDGTPAWASFSAKVYLGEGFLEGAVVDITERKQAEEELIQSSERLRKALRTTVQAMAVMVEVRDPYTAGHQRRVSDLARAIAKVINLPPIRTDGLRMASILHDIGKISVPAEILSKPGKLTELEFNLIKIHPQAGHDILKDIDFPCPVARMVLEHHERMDGSGYPQGLKGEEILLESRILAVADVVEAMASFRPYRPALGIDEALEDITKNKSILYDPQVVETCLRVFREKGFTFDHKFYKEENSEESKTRYSANQLLEQLESKVIKETKPDLLACIYSGTGATS